MTYHLAQMAYYLQHGNLNFYEANFWAQVVQPRASTLLFAYSYLTSQHQENYHPVSSVFSLLGGGIHNIPGIARCSGCRRIPSLLAAFISSLLTETLMEAITTQNDLLMTALVGAAVYFLLAYRQSGNWRNLLFVSMSFSLGLATKSSFLLVAPSLFIIGLFAFLANTTRIRGLALGRDLSLLAVACSASAAVFVLPAGYVDNYRLLGNPIGPTERGARPLRGPFYVLHTDPGQQKRVAFRF